MAYPQMSNLQAKSINCAKLIIRFRDPRAGSVQILLRIYFSCGGMAGNVNVKKLLRMFGSCGVVFELQRIISNQKWANACLVLRYIGLGWFIIMDIFGETRGILQSSKHRHLNI